MTNEDEEEEDEELSWTVTRVLVLLRSVRSGRVLEHSVLGTQDLLFRVLKTQAARFVAQQDFDAISTLERNEKTCSLCKGVENNIFL